jgi:hypothetical protein
MTSGPLSLRRRLDVAGPRPADDVWDRYVRPRRWPEWSPQIRSVDYPGERLTPGTSGTVHGPFRLPVPFRIVEVDEPGRSWSWIASAAGVQLALTHTVTDTATGTRTGLTIDGFAPVVLAYLPAAWVALRRLVH